MEEATLESLKADVQEEDESRWLWFLVSEHGRCFDFISSIKQFRSLVSIMSPTIFIQGAVIMIRNFSLGKAHVAHTDFTILSELKGWIYVRFTLRTSERTVFEEIDNWKVTITLCIVVLRWLCKRLDHNTKINST